jgi:hypothetical protein
VFDKFDLNKIRKRLPSVVALVGAVLIVGASQWFEDKSLEKLTVYVQDSLEPFDALTLGLTFYSELTGCEVQGRTIICKPGPSDTEVLMRTQRDEPGTNWFSTLWTAIVNTAREVGGKSTWLGIAIYFTALAGSGVWLARRLELAESGPAGWVAWVVLLPAIASFVTLGLKWLLLLLTYVFSGVLSGLMFLAGWLGASVTWAVKFVVDVFNTAHKLDSLGGQDAAANLSSSDQPRK